MAAKISRTVAFVLQIEYEGIKQYREESGIEQTLIDPKDSRMVAKVERSLYIDELVPDTVYTFNITAKFMDGSWGPAFTMHVQTSNDGQSHPPPNPALSLREYATLQPPGLLHSLFFSISSLLLHFAGYFFLIHFFLHSTHSPMV